MTKKKAAKPVPAPADDMATEMRNTALVNEARPGNHHVAGNPEERANTH